MSCSELSSPVQAARESLHHPAMHILPETWTMRSEAVIQEGRVKGRLKGPSTIAH